VPTPSSVAGRAHGQSVAEAEQETGEDWDWQVGPTARTAQEPQQSAIGIEDVGPESCPHTPSHQSRAVEMEEIAGDAASGQREAFITVATNDSPPPTHEHWSAVTIMP
jgi:hypothetical protein